MKVTPNTPPAGVPVQGADTAEILGSLVMALVAIVSILRVFC
jgi:hypothetical protein